MEVTRIEELTKSRSKVYIEQQFAFVLYKGELRLYHVREGRELSKQDYDTIMKEVLPKRAKLRAMNLLQKREYTTGQLRKKLTEGFYPEEIIEEALAYVASFHYIDDSRYALDYITQQESICSRRRIEHDLQLKGIDRDTIAGAWSRWEENGGIQDEQMRIRELMAKRNYDPEHTDYREQQKLYGWLMRKGYSGEQIRRAMKVRDE